MAGQAPSRRQVLQALACASVASGAPGFFRWSYAFAEQNPQHTQHRAAPHSSEHARSYEPQFFTPAEYGCIVMLAELILPRTPAEHAATNSRTTHPTRAAIPPAQAGATDAGVAEFIDFMASHDPTLQPAFRQGLLWLDAASSPHTFALLPHAEQTTLLERIAYRKNFREEDKPGQEFFSTMRKYTVMGFYTSQIGLESLDYPGLRFYVDSPAVPQDGSLARLGVKV